MEGSTPIYILHIVSNISNYFDQKAYTMCINDFIDNYHGSFINGAWVPEPFEIDHVQYHQDELINGIAPPCIIVDVIKYLMDNQLWSDWMGEFDRILITRKFIGV